VLPFIRVLLPVLGLLIPLAAGDLSARFVTGPEADSNARREILGEVPRADVLLRNQLSMSFAPKLQNHRLLLEAQLGHKAFFTETTEDLWVAELRFRHDARWTDWLGTFIDVGGRDRRQRSLARSYNSMTLDAGVVLGPFGPVTLLMGAGPRAFMFWPDLRFSFAGAGTFGAAVFRVGEQETLTATTGLDGRMFAGKRSVKILANGAREFDPVINRADSSGFGELAMESVRALYLRASWRVTGNLSNSRGESFARNRLAITTGVVLPGSVRVLVDAQLQLTRWPEGLGLGERLALQEGDENQTSVGAQLSVPLFQGIWMEARTNAYTAEFSSARVPFLRVTAFAGLGYRI